MIDFFKILFGWVEKGKYKEPRPGFELVSPNCNFYEENHYSKRVSFFLSFSLSLSLYIYIYIYMCVCVCVDLCLWVLYGTSAITKHGRDSAYNSLIVPLIGYIFGKHNRFVICLSCAFQIQKTDQPLIAVTGRRVSECDCTIEKKNSTTTNRE